jgi:hypothetical protein
MKQADEVRGRFAWNSLREAYVQLYANTAADSAALARRRVGHG